MNWIKTIISTVKKVNRNVKKYNKFNRKSRVAKAITSINSKNSAKLKTFVLKPTLKKVVSKLKNKLWSAFIGRNVKKVIDWVPKWEPEDEVTGGGGDSGNVPVDWAESLNKKDGLKMYNNLLKSLYNSQLDAEFYGQKNSKIEEILNIVQNLGNKYGRDTVGNYILYLLETGRITQTIINNLYSSDSDLIGEVLVDNDFKEMLTDVDEIEKYKNLQDLIY